MSSGTQLWLWIALIGMTLGSVIFGLKAAAQRRKEETSGVNQFLARVSNSLNFLICYSRKRSKEWNLPWLASLLPSGLPPCI